MGHNTLLLTSNKTNSETIDYNENQNIDNMKCDENCSKKDVANEESNNNNATTDLVKNNISSVALLLFAEFMGYDSPLVTYAEKMLDDVKKKDVPEYMLKIINKDAYIICENMKKEFGSDIVIENYNEFMPLIKQTYQNIEDDLPF